MHTYLSKAARSSVIALLSLLSTIICYGDGSISGPTEVNPGDVSVYRINFGYPVHPLSVISWSVSGGSVISDAGVQSYQVVVLWGNEARGGSVTASEDMGGGNVDLSVMIGNPVSPLSGGNIRTTSRVFNATLSPVLSSDYPATGSTCNTYSYFWEVSVPGKPWTTIHTGVDFPAVYLFTDNTLVRRRVVNCNGEEAISNMLSISYQPADMEPANSYIKTIDVWQKGITSWAQADMLSPGKKFQSNAYLDGFGRPVQTVIKQGSIKTGATDAGDPANWVDLVTHIEYDEENRTAKKYIPYPAADVIGKYKPAAKADQAVTLQAKYSDAPTYSQVEFENSPSGRIVKAFQPGRSGAASPVEIIYGANSIAENVRIWTVGNGIGDMPVTPGAYKSGALHKTVTRNQRGKETVEYKDKDGRLILKKVQDKEDGSGLDRNGHAGWVCTYYLYDDYGNLRTVIQPKGVAYLDLNGWNRFLISAANYALIMSMMNATE